jgi:hypothetical protein
MGTVGAINQMGHSLKRDTHAFAEVDDNAKILMAKWVILDGFWRLNCRKGEEWKFCYVWPQAPDNPRRLVVPSLLQMGWVKSAPYFCAASEIAQDVAVQYVKMRTGSLLRHKFEDWAGANVAKVNNPQQAMSLRCILEVYVNDFIALIVPTSRAPVEHVVRGILQGIHDVFPQSIDDGKDPISAKKLRKSDGTFETKKCILGFDFNGNNKTIWLEEEKRAALLTILHHESGEQQRQNAGSPLQTSNPSQ